MARPLYRKYAGTALVHLLLALRQAIDMLYEEGLENVFATACFAKRCGARSPKWAEGQYSLSTSRKPASEPTR
jgi:alanine-glyoxylate transaminase/serine-glyoxylate transaminase/serine-pyruvate transaminase